MNFQSSSLDLANLNPVGAWRVGKHTWNNRPLQHNLQSVTEYEYDFKLNVNNIAQAKFKQERTELIKRMKQDKMGSS